MVRALSTGASIFGAGCWCVYFYYQINNYESILTQTIQYSLPWVSILSINPDQALSTLTYVQITLIVYPIHQNNKRHCFVTTNHMKSYSYADVKLLRSTLKSALDQLYQTSSQEKVDKVTSILTLMSTAMHIQSFPQDLNTAAQIQLTASMEIFRVKCGMYREFDISKLTGAVDRLLYLFSKYMKGYSRKSKEVPLDIQLLHFFAQNLAHEETFLIYLIIFRLLVNEFQPEAKNLSKIEGDWADLISNLINSLKKTTDERVTSKSIAILTLFCNTNPAFKKEVTKNGLLPYLTDYLEQCQWKYLAVSCLNLITILTEEKPIANMFTQQKPENLFSMLLSKFKADVESKIRAIRHNLAKHSEQVSLAQLPRIVKQELQRFLKGESNEEEMQKRLQEVDAHCESSGFMKQLAAVQIHKQLISALKQGKAHSGLKVQLVKLLDQIINSRENYKTSDDILALLKDNIISNTASSKSFPELQAYLKLLASCARKDMLSKQFVSQAGLKGTLEKYSKDEQVGKVAQDLMTLLLLKEGVIKEVPLNLSKKSKTLKQVEKLSQYLDTLMSLNLFSNLKKQQIQTMAEFLASTEADLQGENEQEAHELWRQTKTKILAVVRQFFSSKEIVAAFASPKLLDALFNSLLDSTLDTDDILELVEVVLLCAPGLQHDKDRAVETLQKIERNNPLSKERIRTCGQILYYEGSIKIGQDMLENFEKQYTNISYLEKLSFYLSTIPDQLSSKNKAAIDRALSCISKAIKTPALDQNQEFIKNMLLVLLRLANLSDETRAQIVNANQILQWAESKLAAHKMHVLQLFESLMPYTSYRINNVNKDNKKSLKDLKPADVTFQRILQKVLDDNKYTQSELNFLEKMVEFNSQPIVDRMKVKDSQTVKKAGVLFAIVMENNKIEGKKTQALIEELQKDVSTKNKHCKQTLRFLAALKNPENTANAGILLGLLQELAEIRLEIYELYPDLYTLLNYTLDAAANSLSNRTKQGAAVDYDNYYHILNNLLVQFRVDEKSGDSSAYDQTTVQGSEELKMHTVENIFTCLAQLSASYRLKLDKNNLMWRIVDSQTNAYLMYRMAQILQNSGVQNHELRDSFRSIVDKKYQKVKQILSLQKADNKGAGQVQKEEKAVVSKQVLRHIDVATATQAAIDMAEGKKSEFIIAEVVNALITENNSDVNNILVKLYMTKMKEQNLKEEEKEALSMIGEKMNQPENAGKLLQAMVEKKQVVEVGEKVKLLGEKALRYAINILREEPAWAARVIEYNLVSEKEYQIIEEAKVDDIVIQLTKVNTKSPEIIRSMALLIGTSSKAKNIQLKYVKASMHKTIMEAITIHAAEPKIAANCFYALAGLAFCLEQATNNLATEENMTVILNIVKTHQASSSVVEAGCCLISNLCYHNQSAKKLFYTCGVIDTVINLFKLSLEASQFKSAPFKQMLRVLGNSSLLMENSKKMITLDFVAISIQLIQIVNFNQDLEILKYIMEVYSNLASHTEADYKPFLSTMFKQGILDILLTLLQTQILNAEIIGACIDSIDGMCQNKQIEKYAVSKRIVPLILDILKSHEWNEKIVVKGVRVISNLTLTQEFIPSLLEANVPSVIANIISNRKLEKSKLSLFTVKIITRVFQAKIRADLILKSGYIDCVIESLKKQTQYYSEHLDILLFYAKDMTEFLSKKTFIAVICLLEKLITADAVANKCVFLLKLIDRQVEIEPILAPLVRLYGNLFMATLKQTPGTSKVRLQQLLNLLIGYLARSPNLKTILRERNMTESLSLIRSYYGEEEIMIKQSTTVCIFIILNNYTMQMSPDPSLTQAATEEFLKNGVQCKMFRRDASSKKAMVRMSAEYELQGFKLPDGQVKDKYRLHLLNVKDVMFDYKAGTNIWELSVFSNSGGIFEKAAEPKHCCTIIGPVTRAGAIMFNLEFATQASKEVFEKHLANMITILRDK